MSNSIELPIEARSIFRILAINKIVERPEFVAKLGVQFDDFLEKIPFSDRIANVEKYPDFLNYSTPHNGDNRDTDIKKMPEEQMCKSPKCFFRELTCKTFDENGKCNSESTVCIIDYQVPLNSSRDIGEGVIDMIGADIGAGGNKIYIIEAKKWDSNEHPLRAMFEAITFCKMLQKGKDGGKEFIQRYTESILNSKNQDASLNEKVKKTLEKEVENFSKEPQSNKAPQSNIELIPVVLIRKNSKIFKKMMDCPIDPNCWQVYGKILNTAHLRCWCYSKVSDEKSEESEVMIEDFTAAFRGRWESR